MRLSISHETTYHYDDQVRASIQYLRLTPHDSERQHVLSWQLELPRPVRAQLDPFGNILHVLTLDEPHDAIIIGARGLVEIDEQREAEHEQQSALPFLRFTRLTEADEALRAFAEQQCKQRRDRSALIDLMHGLNQYMTYTPGSTAVETRAADAFAGRAGVCQDHAHTIIAMARVAGLPARYVSGYLHASEDGNLHEAAHAWGEIYIDARLGWVGFDPANNCCPDDRYIRLGSGYDAQDAAPVKGLALGAIGRETMDVTVALDAVQQ